MEQYDIGARQAKGRYLFFTEPHCIAEPETVSEMIQYINTRSFDGFCARTRPLCTSSIAKMVSRIFEELFIEWSQEDHWSKVYLRGFGIRQRIYVDIGGFQYRYRRFAESLLAATLHAGGYRIGYAPGVGVRHFYENTFELFDASIQDYIDGECLYRLSNSSEFCKRYFGSPAEWNEVRSFDRSLMKMLFRVLWQQLQTRQGATTTRLGWKTCLNNLLRAFSFVIFGQRTFLLKFRSLSWLEKLRCYLWWFHKERRYRAFVDYYMAMISLYRVKWVLEHAEQLPQLAITRHLCYNIEEIDRNALFGFHALESYQGTRFCWTSPVAALKISLEPDDYAVTVQLYPARYLVPDKELSVFLNQMPIQSVVYDQVEHTLNFSLSKNALIHSEQQWLLFLCIPWTLQDVRLTDKRLLGIPLISVRFEPRMKTS
jgi:hypothetical protein